MKKILLSFGVIALLIFATSCGKKPEEPVKPVEPKQETKSAAQIQIVVVQKSEDPAPAWVNKRWEIGKDEMGKKVIFLAVEGQRNTKEKAEIDAESKKISRLSELIKQVATREFAVAKSGMLNDDTELDAYFEETVAAVSKNVNISGAMNIADYWEYVQEIQGDSSKTYYRYIKRYAMDFDVYQKALKSAWEPVKKTVPPELKDKAQKVLDSLNQSQEAMSE
jgi:predicted small lipoprotein YifL